MPTARSRRLRRPAKSVLLATAAAVVLGACTSSPLADREQEVAERGSQVMPFDLEATTHRWTPTDDGLHQTVVADDPLDSEQIDLIRQHLQLEARRFARGDFQDPETIHGADMPGLALLRAHDGRIAVTYQETTDGAALTFSTSDQRLVDALHEWAEAQVSDHGPHAESH